MEAVIDQTGQAVQEPEEEDVPKDEVADAAREQREFVVEGLYHRRRSMGLPDGSGRTFLPSPFSLPPLVTSLASHRAPGPLEGSLRPLLEVPGGLVHESRVQDFRLPVDEEMLVISPVLAPTVPGPVEARMVGGLNPPYFLIRRARKVERPGEK